MVTVIDVCVIIITIAILALIIPLFFLFREIKRMRSTTEHIMEKIDGEFTPLIANLKTISHDLGAISSLARSQVEQVDVTASALNKKLLTVVEQWTSTASLLHEVVDESAVDVAAFLRGLSRGVKFFFKK